MTCQALWRGQGCMNAAETTRRQRGSPRRTEEHSGEQSRAAKCKTRGNRGRVRTITLREDSGAHERRPGHDKDTGRRWRNCGGEPVSVDQANQRGRGESRGVAGCG
jgi:hypothetical protein